MVRRLKEDNQKVIAESKIREHEEALQFEDLRSYMLKRHDYSLKL